MSQKYINNNGELERIPGTENDPLTLGEKTLLEPELKIMSTELNLNQPTLPGMKNLPVTKPKAKELPIIKAFFFFPEAFSINIELSVFLYLSDVSKLLYLRPKESVLQYLDLIFGKLLNIKKALQ